VRAVRFRHSVATLPVCVCVGLPSIRMAATLMTMTANSDDLPQRQIAEPAAANRRGGSAVLVLVVALAVVGAALAFMWLGRSQAQPYILALLALLAMLGLFMLFAFAAGIVQFADCWVDDPIIRTV